MIPWTIFEPPVEFKDEVAVNVRSMLILVPWVAPSGSVAGSFVQLFRTDGTNTKTVPPSIIFCTESLLFIFRYFVLSILIITILTCIGFFVYLMIVKNADTKIRIAVALILGGAVGNLFDRIVYGIIYNYAPLFQGNVVDFLDVRIFKIFLFDNIHGNYVFNFADVSILSGVFLLIYLILSSKKQKNVKGLIPQIVDDKEDSN